MSEVEIRDNRDDQVLEVLAVENRGNQVLEVVAVVLEVENRVNQVPGVVVGNRDDQVQFYDISENTKTRISRSIGETLKYIHSRHVIYRDLKPENIMIDLVSSNIKFVDFGLAKVITRPVRGIAGTPGYIAPEILKEHPYGFPADVYSFGMTLFVLWSERGPTKKTLIPLYLKDTPRMFRSLVMDCLRHTPSERPEIDEIIERLREQDRPSLWWRFFCC